MGPPWRGVVFDQPGPPDREYQIDGSDTTATSDRVLSNVGAMRDSALYRFDAWLRDEDSYSRWEQIRLTDLTSGQPVPPAGWVMAAPDANPRDTPGGGLPEAFRLDAALRRPEAAARLWLVAAGDRREGLELDRDRRNARWLLARGGGIDALPRWFFPEQPAPFAAALLHLLGRGTAAAYGLGLAALLVARGGAIAASTVRGYRRGAPALGQEAPRALDSRSRTITDVALGAWLLGAALVAVRVYHQSPHVLDAVSYSFQAGLFAAGRLTAEAPPLAAAFKGPFEVLWQGRLFSQYPPGAPVLYALGQLVSLAWLVGPLACLALIAATSWTAGELFGPLTGRVVLALGVLSPFVLFQSGSFLSHPIAGGLLALSLAAFVRGERHGRVRWYAVAGGLLGASFTAREVASMLFAVPLTMRLVTARPLRTAAAWRPIGAVVAGGLPFVLLYLLYNAAVTGDATVLPRTLFDPSDRFGFGDGIGFHTRHTLAAGLVNADEMLTLLQFDLFGWPPLVALGLLAAPLLFGRATAWGTLAAIGFLTFVAAYTGYFYHGNALGPRYYFEAMPWLLLLAGRGAQVLAGVARSRVAVALVLGLLSAHTLTFFLPAAIERRTDLSGSPDGRRVSLSFLQTGVFGPRLTGIPTPALVVTDDWWLFNTSLAALNCADLPRCDVLFALATNAADQAALRAAFPERAFLRAVDRGGRVDAVPAA